MADDPPRSKPVTAAVLQFILTCVFLVPRPTDLAAVHSDPVPDYHRQHATLTADDTDAFLLCFVFPMFYDPISYHGHGAILIVD